MGMELFFNSVWALVATASVVLWLRSGRRGIAERRLSFVSLVMLIVILFPVISVSDDLWSIQNPAEADSSQRRDHQVTSHHSIFPATAILPVPAVAELSFVSQRVPAQPERIQPGVDDAALGPIQNRPPPTA